MDCQHPTNHASGYRCVNFLFFLLWCVWVCPAVKNVRGEYYLNGHWAIDFSRALHIASTVVHYDRGSEGDLAPELLHARGPTTEPLIIEVSSRACPLLMVLLSRFVHQPSHCASAFTLCSGNVLVGTAWGRPEKGADSQRALVLLPRKEEGQAAHPLGC